MKRHLRIVIDGNTVVGRSFERSGWFRSRPIDAVSVTTFKPSFDDQDEFAARASAMLGYEWHPQNSAFDFGDAYVHDFRVHTLAAHPRWQWLADNATFYWLPCTTTYVDSVGYYRQRAHVWFQDDGDRTLFDIATA
jgi:hypothetical protein